MGREPTASTVRGTIDRVDALLVIEVGPLFELARFDGEGCIPLGPVADFTDTPGRRLSYLGSNAFGFSSAGRPTLSYWRDGARVETSLSATDGLNIVRSPQQIWARGVGERTALTDFDSEILEVRAGDTAWGDRFFRTEISSDHVTCFRRDLEYLIDRPSQQGTAHVVLLEGAVAVANDVSAFLFTKDDR